MSNKKIQDLPLKTPIDAMKIPTGGFGDYAITVKGVLDHFINNHNIVQKKEIDDLKELINSLEVRLSVLENKVK